MKRVRITLDPAGAYAPPLYRRLAGGASSLERVHIVNWNVVTGFCGGNYLLGVDTTGESCSRE